LARLFSLVYRDAEYSEKLAKELCRKNIFEYGGMKKKVSPEQLERLGLLKHVNNKIMPINAFMMLTDNPFREARVQCGLFKGTERVKFLDKREFKRIFGHRVFRQSSFTLLNRRVVFSDEPYISGRTCI